MLLGVKGLLVEDLEMAKGGLMVMSDKSRDELGDYVETGDAAGISILICIYILICMRAKNVDIWHSC